MALKRPSEEKIINGTRILVYGEAGTRKTRFALSFPKNAYINADQGGDDYYDEFKDNLAFVSDSITFSEVLNDIDEIEDNLDEIDTITIDSWTKIYENQQHVALRVVEQRARKNNRMVEGEGLSQKEWGNIKLNAEKLASKALGFKRDGKTVIIIAEGKDEMESYVDAQGQTQRKKVGITFNAQKDFDFDFDIVLEMVRDPKTKQTIGARVLKDRLGVVAEGEIVENPTYEIWAEAIEYKKSGTKKAPKRDFEGALKEDEKNFNADSEAAQIDALRKEITKIKDSLTKEKQGELVRAFTKEIGDAKYLSCDDTEKLKKYLEVAKTVK
jgi:hypothetical protein